MIEAVISAIGVYVSTSIDYLFILLILFSQLDNPKDKKQIYAGQYVGTGLLVAVSLIAVYILDFIPKEWMVGLLGLIPIYLGIHFVLTGEDDEDEEAIINKVKQGGSRNLFWIVTLLTISSGGDNLGIYIPYFASISWLQIIIALLIFAIGVIVLCEISRMLSSIPLISETVEKYERIIVPIVFVLLGIYIMWELTTIQTIWSYFFN